MGGEVTCVTKDEVHHRAVLIVTFEDTRVILGKFTEEQIKTKITHTHTHHTACKLLL